MLPFLHLEIERWKFNKEYEVYVSNLGNVRDMNKKPLHFYVNPRGYLLCNVKGGNYLILVHRLVLQTFCPISNYDNMTVDHLDHNKRNNKVSNLEWVTEQENKARAKKDFINEKETFIWFGPYKVKSCKEAAQIIIKEQQIQINEERDLLRVSSTIGTCVNNKNKEYYGYTFVRCSERERKRCEIKGV